MAVDKSDPTEWKLCPCNDYEPGRPAPRSTLRVLGEHGRAHERRMRKLRPAVFARDGFRCVAGVSPSCSGRAEHAHHVLPLSRGGEDTPDNLISVCGGPSGCHAFIHEHPSESSSLGLLR
jgi:5-methylcytosine-specific restriction endonuclease McrA